MKFILIPPGEFTMGSTPEEIEEALKVGNDKHWQERIESEAPRHKVILTRPIYLGIHEVTQNEYEQVMGKNPSNFAKTGPEQQWVEKVEGLDTAGHPVEGVSWNDAAEFCAKLSERENLKPVYARNGESVTDARRKRLPVAKRSAVGIRLPCGDDNEVLDRRQGRRLTASRLVRCERRPSNAQSGRTESQSVRDLRYSRQCHRVGTGRVGTGLLWPISGQSRD